MGGGHSKRFPESIIENFSLFDEKERSLISMLIDNNQEHLFEDCEAKGINDSLKHDFLNQIALLDSSYPGGLSAYISRSRSLLKSAQNGENPLEGWIPEVPSGISLNPASNEFDDFEIAGMQNIGLCGFILVAGGLGERLGYNGIKIELPVETTTSICYLEFYCQSILSIQQKYAPAGMKVPLAIMVSGETDSKTLQLLESNNYFGMDRDQVTIMKQEKVAAIISTDGKLAKSSTYAIDSKPHGHGDVHYLMHSTGTAKRWRDSGIKWCVFFQDTNSLGFLSILSVVGVSALRQLDVNSVTIPRKAKQAIGAIARLRHDRTGQQLVINVEYNQLDPMLRAVDSASRSDPSAASGDVNDPVTGNSPYPGNINQLVFKLESYVSTLERTGGSISEFVNPKYADEQRMVFKKPTRLECMMQDYPKLLDPSAAVAFTMLPAWFCYNPCKNNSADGCAALRSGIPASSAYTAESEYYFANAELLRVLGAAVPSAEEQSFLGIAAVPGPRIVFHPTFANSKCDLRRRFVCSDRVEVSPQSSLVLRGDVRVRSLRLAGALEVVAEAGSTIIVDCGDSLLANAGDQAVPLSSLAATSTETTEVTPAGAAVRLEARDSAAPGEVDRMRGYRLERRARCSVRTPHGAGLFIFDGKTLRPAGEKELSTSG